MILRLTFQLSTDPFREQILPTGIPLNKRKKEKKPLQHAWNDQNKIVYKVGLGPGKYVRDHKLPPIRTAMRGFSSPNTVRL